MAFSFLKGKPQVAEVDIQSTLHKNLGFTAIEQYKLLRTNLNFTIPEGVTCPVIGITSSNRGEGKSTTAINLSYVLAERGSRVMLLDCDLRIPSIASKMGIPNTNGLTSLLMGKGAQIGDYQTDVLKNWFIIPGGDIPPNPSELLSSKRMEAILNDLKSRFDYIIMDLPPINLVSDALSASPMITGMVLVIREHFTTKKELENCFRLLNLSNVNILGCVMNGATSDKTSYRYRKSKDYKYYHYHKKKNNPYETSPEVQVQGTISGDEK